jgi:hypothetical protein
MDDAQNASARIARLLEEVRASVSPMAWGRVDELVSSLVELYGRALVSLYDAVDPEDRPALARDELVASLLALHGIHLLPLEARVREALDALAPQLGRLELIACADGLVQLRAVDAPAVPGAQALVEAALQESAPEVEHVEIDGLREPASRGALVQIDVARSRTG